MRRLRFVRDYTPLVLESRRYWAAEVALIEPLWLAQAFIDLGYAVAAP
jgi:hypothetical protein